MVFLAGHIVDMVTYCATKLTATCSSMIGVFVDTTMLTSTSILGFQQSCDQNKNRNHSMKKVKSLRYDK